MRDLESRPHRNKRFSNHSQFHLFQKKLISFQKSAYRFQKSNQHVTSSMTSGSLAQKSTKSSWFLAIIMHGNELMKHTQLTVSVLFGSWDLVGARNERDVLQRKLSCFFAIRSESRLEKCSCPFQRNNNSSMLPFATGFFFIFQVELPDKVSC